MSTIVGSVSLVLTISIICAACVYGCVNNNQQYYKAMSECVAAGGSAVPVGNASATSSIVCIRK